MQCFEKRESKNIKERRKIYAARDFSDKYNHALLSLFKYQIKLLSFYAIKYEENLINVIFQQF